MTISTVIISKNEEKNIQKCLESVIPFSNEIIVVDDFSKDNTSQIAKSFSKVKFIEHKFENYINQKNYANSLVSSDYIFSLDADEYCTNDLISFLKRNRYRDYDAVSFHRINMFKDKPVRYGLWKDDHKLRLWKNGLGQWAGTMPHEHLDLKCDSSVLKTQLQIMHNAYSSYEDLYIKSMNYALMASLRYKDRTNISLYFSMIFNPIVKFFKGYIFKTGFMDGKYGWYVAKVSFIETFKKYREAIKLKSI